MKLSTMIFSAIILIGGFAFANDSDQASPDSQSLTSTESLAADANPAESFSTELSTSESIREPDLASARFRCVAVNSVGMRFQGYGLTWAGARIRAMNHCYAVSLYCAPRACYQVAY